MPTHPLTRPRASISVQVHVCIYVVCWSSGVHVLREINPDVEISAHNYDITTVDNFQQFMAAIRLATPTTESWPH